MTGQFIEQLTLVAGSDRGVALLRTAVLDFAIRGLLVTQDGVDEPADVLLARITALKVTKQSKLKTTQEAVATAPYALPRGWAWTRLADVALINPRNQADDESEASFVPMASIGTGFGDAHAQEVRRWGDIKTGFTHFAEGDIGVAKITPCFENSKACVFSGLINGIGAGTTELHVVRPVVDTLAPRYVLAYLKSPWFLHQGESKMTGTAGQKRLPKDFIEQHPFPLPPLPEQHRIVAKVDELMALCDRLEAQQQNAEAAHARLVQTLLDSLTQARGANEFQACWQRLAVHFQALITREEDVNQLRRCVLDLAVRGRLSSRAAGDGSVSELLSMLTTKQAQSGRKRRAKIEDRAGVAPPFDVPTGWAWIKIGEIADRADYGLSEKTAHLSDGARVLKMGDVQDGQVLLDTAAMVRFETVGLPDLLLERGDLLYNRTNSAELVGKTGIFKGPPATYSFASYLIRLRFDPEFISADYVNFAMNAPYFRATQINPLLKQQCGQANVNGTAMQNMLIPLPPVEEQRRIVAAIHVLFDICDQLKTHIASARTKHAQLAVALVEAAVA